MGKKKGKGQGPTPSKPNAPGEDEQASGSEPVSAAPLDSAKPSQTAPPQLSGGPQPSTNLPGTEAKLPDKPKEETRVIVPAATTNISSPISVPDMPNLTPPLAPFVPTLASQKQTPPSTSPMPDATKVTPITAPASLQEQKKTTPPATPPAPIQEQKKATPPATPPAPMKEQKKATPPATPSISMQEAKKITSPATPPAPTQESKKNTPPATPSVFTQEQKKNTPPATPPVSTQDQKKSIPPATPSVPTPTLQKSIFATEPTKITHAAPTPVSTSEAQKTPTTAISIPTQEPQKITLPGTPPALMPKPQTATPATQFVPNPDPTKPIPPPTAFATITESQKATPALAPSTFMSQLEKATPPTLPMSDLQKPGFQVPPLVPMPLQQKAATPQATHDVLAGTIKPQNPISLTPQVPTVSLTNPSCVTAPKQLDIAATPSITKQDPAKSLPTSQTPTSPLTTPKEPLASPVPPQPTPMAMATISAQRITSQFESSQISELPKEGNVQKIDSEQKNSNKASVEQASGQGNILPFVEPVKLSDIGITKRVETEQTIKKDNEKPSQKPDIPKKPSGLMQTKVGKPLPTANKSAAETAAKTDVSTDQTNTKQETKIVGPEQIKDTKTYESNPMAKTIDEKKVTSTAKKVESEKTDQKKKGVPQAAANIENKKEDISIEPLAWQSKATSFASKSAEAVTSGVPSQIVMSADSKSSQPQHISSKDALNEKEGNKKISPATNEAIKETLSQIVQKSNNVTEKQTASSKPDPHPEKDKPVKTNKGKPEKKGDSGSKTEQEKITEKPKEEILPSKEMKAQPIKEENNAQSPKQTLTQATKTEEIKKSVSKTQQEKPTDEKDRHTNTKDATKEKDEKNSEPAEKMKEKIIKESLITPKQGGKGKEDKPATETSSKNAPMKASGKSKEENVGKPYTKSPEQGSEDKSKSLKQNQIPQKDSNKPKDEKPQTDRKPDQKGISEKATEDKSKSQKVTSNKDAGKSKAKEQGEKKSDAKFANEKIVEDKSKQQKQVSQKEAAKGNENKKSEAKDQPEKVSGKTPGKDGIKDQGEKKPEEKAGEKSKAKKKPAANTKDSKPKENKSVDEIKTPPQKDLEEKVNQQDRSPAETAGDKTNKSETKSQTEIDETSPLEGSTTAAKRKRRRKKNKKPAEGEKAQDIKEPPSEKKESKSPKKQSQTTAVVTGTKDEKQNKPPSVNAANTKLESIDGKDTGESTSAKKKKNKKKKKQGAGTSENITETDNTGDEKKTSIELPKSKLTVNALAHHLSNCCCVCKATVGVDKSPLLTCTACSLACYCGRKHQVQHWQEHKEFCSYISTVISKERPYFFTPAEKMTQDERRHFKLTELQLCQKALNRSLTPLESALILHPRACYSCYKPAFQNVCQGCYCINYCCPEHLPSDHKGWCSTFRIKLLFVQSQAQYGANGVSVQKPSKVCYPINSNMDIYLKSLDFSPPNKMEKDLYLAHMSELATYPLTLLHALQLLATQGATNPLDYEHLVVHVVGAEDVYECCQILKWKYFFVNLLPKLKSLHLVFIGCELTIEDEKVHVEGRLVYEFHAKMTYLDYCRKCYIKPSIVCAFNSGLYRNTGFKGTDSWGPSLYPMLNMNVGVPVLLTAYTHMESQLDLQRLKEIFSNNLQVVQLPIKNPYASIFPNHNLVSEHECPVAFRNYFLTIVRHN